MRSIFASGHPLRFLSGFCCCFCCFIFFVIGNRSKKSLSENPTELGGARRLWAPTCKHWMVSAATPAFPYQSLATSFDDSTRMSSVRSIFTSCYPLHFCSGFCCCFCCFMLFFFIGDRSKNSFVKNPTELGELCGDEVLRQSQICKDCLSEKFPSARLFTSTGHAASSKKCLPCCSTVAMPLFTTSTRVYVFTPLYRMSEIQSLATSFDDSTRMSSVRSIFASCHPLRFCSGFCCCFCCFMLFFVHRRQEQELFR